MEELRQAAGQEGRKEEVRVEGDLGALPRYTAPAEGAAGISRRLPGFINMFPQNSR